MMRGAEAIGNKETQSAGLLSFLKRGLGTALV